MAKSEQEIEVKFFVRALEAIAGRLEAVGAKLTSPRVLETNLRFDTPDSKLTNQRQVLRLRQDTASILTFKGPADPNADVSMRTEIEFQVSDFQAARHFLEALGYEVAVIYEKYRTTYSLDDLMITLDEMPFGNFIEIEGPDSGSIERAAQALKLNWQARGVASYIGLFYQFRSARGLFARNLTFDEVQGEKARPEDIGMQYADAEFR
jgi:adenylate cyclase class 2